MDASISHRMAPFDYDPLPDAARYIRLLEVLEDKCLEDVKVRCRITTWPIDNKPSYYAMSYAWGNPGPAQTIFINNQAFPVQENCEFILKQAYWYNKASYYWVDAICINQGNPHEKSKQVSIMGKIYQQAARVLACVGDHMDDSAFLLSKLKKRPFTERLVPGMDGLRLSLRFRLRQRLYTTVRFLRAVFCFLDRLYFTRMWILQELRNAQQTTFLCGPDAIPGHVIRDMVEGIFDHQTSTFWHKKVAFSRRLLILRRFCSVQAYWWKFPDDDGEEDGRLWNIAQRASLLLGNEMHIMLLFHAATRLGCQIRRDKIFGLISLIDWGVSGPPSTDYTQTEVQVTVDFVKALLNAGYPRDDFGGTIYEMCISISRSVGLDWNSIDVLGALESRLVEMGNYPAGENYNVVYTHSGHQDSTGWRVSSRHINKTDLGFSTWNPPGDYNSEVHLPSWVKDGDWVVMAGPASSSSQRFMLVREDIDGFGGSIIGHAVGSIAGTTEVPCAKFGIHWDPEDLLIYSITQQEMGASWTKVPLLTVDLTNLVVRRLERGESEYRSPGLVRGLNTAICRNRTPRSSYTYR